MNTSRTRRRLSWSWQRWLTGLLCVAFAFSTVSLLRMFYVDSTVQLPTTGGTYIEGSVGNLQPLNPWFTLANDVSRDINSLVFAGLLKYNPETKQIEDDLGTLKISPDGRVYTITLKDGLEWHDSTPEQPHLVTIDDVLFTFQTIKDAQFPNSLLRQNFRGVEVEDVDDRTVRFLLEEPYRFFSSNLTLGLLPKRAFEGVPVHQLDQALDFAFHPIGAGPYAFKGLVQTELSTEVTLERFQRSVEPNYHLDRVVFRIFRDFPTLLSDLRNLNGVRLVPRNEDGTPVIPRRFEASDYTLPQYVALFLNTETSFLQDKQLRLALQLGTNKQALIDAINEQHIIDTPLLEIDVSDWRYQFDQTAAQGALFSSDWHLPEKVRLQRLLELRDVNTIGALQLEPVALLATGASLTITGALADTDSLEGITVNGLPIYPLADAGSGAWTMNLPTWGSGQLKLGDNYVVLTDADGTIIDTAYVWRTNDTAFYNRAIREAQLVDLFIASRDEVLPLEERITVADLFLEKGMLRRRLSTDPIDIRVNDDGEKLALRLLTSPSPPQYQKIAALLQEQWALLGIHVGIDVPKNREEFEERLLKRDYDVVLFGQSLLDNLDSYPYWHSSGVQRLEDDDPLRLDAYNLSQYSSLEADSLLELIRRTEDDEERTEAMTELRQVIKDDIPAIFLYSPLYTYAYHEDLFGVDLGSLSRHSDRFLTLHRWYFKKQRVFRPGINWFSFPKWLLGHL